MNPLEIILIAAIVVAAAGVFLAIIRNDARKVRAGEAEAEAKGETVKKRPPLGILYFGLGLAFIVFGIFQILGHR